MVIQISFAHRSRAVAKSPLPPAAARKRGKRGLCGDTPAPRQKAAALCTPAGHFIPNFATALIDGQGFGVYPFYPSYTCTASGGAHFIKDAKQGRAVPGLVLHLLFLGWGLTR